MADELDKAVDLVRQLLADDNAKEKLSGVMESIMSAPENQENTFVDSPLTGVLDSLLSEDKEGQIGSAPDLGSVLSSGLLQNAFSGKSDKRVTLLRALKPYLSEKRSSRIENAITMMQIIGFSSSMGLDKLFK